MIAKAGAFHTIGTPTGLVRELVRRVQRSGEAVLIHMPNNIHSSGDGRRDLLRIVDDAIGYARTCTVNGDGLYAVLWVHEIPGRPEHDLWYASIYPAERWPERLR